MLPWPMTVYPPLSGWPGPAHPAPSRATLPPPGDYVVDPGRTTLTVSVRTLRRRITGRTTGMLGHVRVGRGDDVAVVLHADATGLRTGDAEHDALLLGPRVLDAAAFPLLHVTAADLGSGYGEWVLHALLHVRGGRVPLMLWLGHARRLPDGAVAITACGDLDRWAAGVRIPLAGRHARVDLELTAVPERRATRVPSVAPAGARP